MSSKQWHGGKGSQRRKESGNSYQSNWDRIFGGIDYTTVDNGKGTVETVDNNNKSDDDDVDKSISI
jgi:hypothetical protein